MERDLPEAIRAGGEKATVAQVAYETLSSNVERLRSKLAAARAATQAATGEEVTAIYPLA